MNHSQSPDEELESLLGQFHRELEDGEDSDVVVRRHVARHPQFAKEFEEAASMGRLMDGAAEEGDTPLPERLGDFRILREISHGGMGIICEAIQESLNRRVAVKIIRRGHISPEHRQRFLREQEILAKLHQTNIVPVFAAGKEGPIQYFAMQLIDGASLNLVVRTVFELDASNSKQKTPALSRLVSMVKGKANSAVCGFDATASTEIVSSRGTASSTVSFDANRTSSRLKEGFEEFSAAGARFSLSKEYFQSVAEVMAQVGESLHHAHQHNIIHRDLKPGNIMVDTAGQSWLIDFGLAAYLSLSEPTRDLPSGTARTTDVAHTKGALGTLGYIAPEQHQSQPVDARTDVWGLGVTLYELLTLRRAFPGHLNLYGKSSEPLAPPVRARQLVPNLCRDLEAICSKAMQSQPETRYESAGEFAADLRHWQRSEPTMAFPANTLRRVYLWAQRNRGWAAAILSTAFLFIVVSLFNAREAKHAKNREELTTSMDVNVRNLVRSVHSSGWSKDAWRTQSEIVPLGGRDVAARMRNRAATILHGLDSRTIKCVKEFGAGYVLFDRECKRVLLGSVYNARGQLQKARLWDLANDRFESLEIVADGPIAFSAGGMPLQFFVEDDRSLVLMDLINKNVVTRFSLPQGTRLQKAPVLALLPDGSLAATSATSEDKQASVIVWDGASGAPLLKFPEACTAVAFSPNRSLAAFGNEKGTVWVVLLKTGERIAALPTSSSEVSCLAFARDVRRTKHSAEDGDWLLAAGDVAGGMTIWDVGAKIPRSFCRGSQYQTLAATFSPDNATMASTARGEIYLWDVATGRLLLKTQAGDGITGVAFSPDGNRLAYGSRPPNSDGGVVFGAWELENGRGIASFRGLVSKITRTCFSQDGRYLAALALDWQVGIWNFRTGQLLHVLDGPHGLSADNAGLAFSPDGRLFAVSAGRESRLWSVETGQTLNSWKLPRGLCDSLDFVGSKELMLLRSEVINRDGDPDAGPFGEYPPAKYPRICVLRNLLGERPTEPIKVVDELTRHIYTINPSPDGKYFAVDGLCEGDNKRRKVLLLNAKGTILQTFTSTRTCNDGEVSFDVSGSILAAHLDNRDEAALLELPSGKYAGLCRYCPISLSPQSREWTYAGTLENSVSGVSYFRRDSSEPLVTLGMDDTMTFFTPAFDPSGRFLAWGRDDGVICVADLLEVQRRLAELGLGWE
jgi:eukaryotic-like serine/threonine-protein kinase